MYENTDYMGNQPYKKGKETDYLKISRQLLKLFRRNHEIPFKSRNKKTPGYHELDTL